MGKKNNTSINRLRPEKIEEWRELGEGFNAGNVVGKLWAEFHGTWLSDEWLEVLRAHHREGIDYVIYSYGTPIAWHTHRGWVHVTDTFSISTSSHQSTVRQLRPWRTDFRCSGEGSNVPAVATSDKPTTYAGNAMPGRFGVCPVCTKMMLARNGEIPLHLPQRAKASA